MVAVLYTVLEDMDGGRARHGDGPMTASHTPLPTSLGALPSQLFAAAGVP